MTVLHTKIKLIINHKSYVILFTSQEVAINMTYEISYNLKINKVQAELDKRLAKKN